MPNIDIIMVILKILVVVIPILLALNEKKGRGEWYLRAIILLLFLSVWNEISEYIAKSQDDKEKVNLHKARTLDSNRINSLLKYDTTITISNNSLKNKADSLLTSNFEIQRKLDAIKLAIANSNYKYDAIKGMIVPKNTPVAKEKQPIDSKKAISNSSSINYYSRRISALQKHAEQCKPILKKDSVNLKSVSERHWYKLRNDENITTEITIARIQLYKDNSLFKAINDSIIYYQTKLKTASFN